MIKIKAFPYYGGKYSHLSFILPLLSRTDIYCEVFGGSGSVLLNRAPSPVEVLNDMDSEIVNFFKVLREKEEDLVRAILLTPYSREEYVKSFEFEGESELERARKFFVRVRQSRNNSIGSNATPGTWSFTRQVSRNGMVKQCSAWLNSTKHFSEIVNRLQRVQIENSQAIDIILRYDTSGTLFYCDPPYPKEARTKSHCYAHEMIDSEHIELAEVLHSIQGKAAVSGYSCKLYEELYSDWEKTIAPERYCFSSNSGAKRQEVLWTNYLPERQLDMFSNSN